MNAKWGITSITSFHKSIVHTCSNATGTDITTLKLAQNAFYECARSGSAVSHYDQVDLAKLHYVPTQVKFNSRIQDSRPTLTTLTFWYYKSSLLYYAIPKNRNYICHSINAFYFHAHWNIRIHSTYDCRNFRAAISTDTNFAPWLNIHHSAHHSNSYP